MNIDFSQIKCFRNGEAGLIGGLFQEMKLLYFTLFQLFPKKSLFKSTGIFN